MEFFREDKINLKVDVLEESIIRVHSGGLDGYQDSLLNRYGFIEDLSELQTASWNGCELCLPDGYSLSVKPDLSLELRCRGVMLSATSAGYRPGTAPTVFQNQGYSYCATISPEEKFIGFGDQYRKGFLLNGQRESLWIRNQSDYIPVPFFMSSKGYGILFNTTRRLHYDFGVKDPDIYSVNVSDEYLDMYIFTGADYWEMIRKYTFLTGRPQLPPMYTFGLWMVAHTEIRAHELLQLALEMRKAEIPCDILALEPLWMQKLYDESLDKNWNEERFPYFPWVKKSDTFIGDLKLMGYHFGLWMLSDYDHTWEEERRVKGILPDIYRENEDIVAEENLQIAEQDEHFGHHPMLMDKVTRPDEVYFEHLKKFVDQGVDYFKQDGYAQINLHPDRLYGNQCRDDVMHNIHYMIYTRQMIRGFEEHTGRRGFTLAVAGWTGFQRFPGTWCGDTGGGEQSLCAILQLSTVGHAFATCDMEVDTKEGIHMGFLLPWSQLCSWSYYKYPVYKGEAVKAVFKYYTELRMRLLPLYYSLAREASISGKAIARPMHLVYPDVDEAYSLTRQFMIGDSFITAVYSDSIVLPDGRWFDYWTNRIISGDWTSRQLKYPESRGGLLLVKSGAIIPLFPVQQFTGEKAVNNIAWQIFPAAGQSEFTLYLDNGTDFAYRQGNFASAKLICRQKNECIQILWDELDGADKKRITSCKYTFELLGVTGTAAVKVDGAENPFKIDYDTNRTLIESIAYGSRIEIQTTRTI